MHRVRAMIEMHRVRVFLAFSGRLGVCVCVVVSSVCVVVFGRSGRCGARPPGGPSGIRQSRGGRAASRCGITMWHHDAASRRSCRAARRLLQPSRRPGAHGERRRDGVTDPEDMRKTAILFYYIIFIILIMILSSIMIIIILILIIIILF